MNYYDSIENRNLKLLDSLNFTRFNDSAKWRLYTLHCDDTTLQDKKYLSLSSLNLKLVYVRKVNDTLDLLYQFMKDDSIPIGRYPGQKYISDGVQFKTSENAIIGFLRGEGTVWEKGQDSRYEYPLQPEVIAYIKNNENNLNPWFKMEAKKKGILQ